MRKTILAAGMSLLMATGVVAQEGEENHGRPDPAKMRAAIAKMAGKEIGTVIYTNVKMIDGKSDRLQENLAIVVEGERIAKIAPMSGLASLIVDGASIVDAGKWYLTPGLIDTHVHLATLPSQEVASAYLKRYLYAGITTVRDMAGDIRSLADISRATLVNEMEGPDVKYSALMAGPSFFKDPRTVASGLGETPGSISWMQSITDETDLKEAVAQARGTWASGIKIYANLPGKLVRNIIKEAKRQDFPVWTHVQVFPASPFDSVEAGATAVSHACMIAQYAARPGAAYHDARPDISSITPDHPVIQKYIKAIKKSGTVYDATLLVHPPAGSDNQSGMCSREFAGELTSAFIKAGVPVSTGTDGSSEPDDPYPGLNLEFEILTEHAGMTPAQLIKAATINGAKATGIEDEVGTIEPGKYANFAFFEKNPLEGVESFRSVALTVKRGKKFYRKDYKHKDIPALPWPEL